MHGDESTGAERSPAPLLSHGGAPAPSAPRLDGVPPARRVVLPTGTLEIQERGGAVRLDDICSYAARRNPRRGFLFVSHLLGRYLPVRPAEARAAHRRLAAAMPEVEGPVAVLGIAEAGVGLAHGVFDVLAERRPALEAVFLHSTRHHLPAPLALDFDEAHSHAPEHRVHLPREPHLQSRLQDARTAVIVDDEITTGRTFRGLVSRWRARFPKVRRFVHLVLKSWLDAPLPAEIHGARIEVISLVEGRFRWTQHSRHELPPGVVGAPARERGAAALPSADWGRFGVGGRRLLPRLLGAPPPPGTKVLVVGTEELQYPGFLLAERLEARGHDARFVATTRSPVALGAAIRRLAHYPDCYGEGRTVYLYNVDPDAFDRIYLLTDAPRDRIPARLVEDLDAHVLCV